jgi:hypothetical protein
LRSSNENEAGALVLAPLYADMPRDIWPNPADVDQAKQLAGIVDYLLDKTAEFVHHSLGANFVGLGATLPLLTNFGNKLRQAPGMNKLTTTRRSNVDSGGTVGVIGAAGSIGWSSVLALKKMLPDHKIEVFDKRVNRMQAMLAANTDLGALERRESAADVFKNNNYVVCAITDKLDLDAPEFTDIDFSNIKAIDDSQPGAIDRVQIENRNGQVFWVAGKDASANRFMTRDGYYTDGAPYNYGDNSGLYGKSTEFACGLEAATIAARGNKWNAINKPVEYKDVQVVGNLFDEYGVDVADFQSFGKPVDIR